MAKITRPRRPDARTPIIDPKTGIMTPEWATYFLRLEDYAASLEARLVHGGL